MTLDQFEDIDQAEETLTKNLQQIVEDLLLIFRSDLASFVAKEIRKRFVDNEKFAETFSDQQLLELKKQAEEVGQTKAEEICDGLEGDWDFFFGPQIPIGEGKSFESHLKLMERLQGIAHATIELLEKYKFPKDQGDDYQVSYVPPAYFVNGKYAPGLAEAFWKNLGKLSEVRAARTEQELGRRRAVQRNRWDTIEERIAKQKS